MLNPGLEELIIDDHGEARSVVDRLRSTGGARVVLLRDAQVALSGDVVERMVAALSAPMASTVSPIPVAASKADTVIALDPDPGLPPAPSLSIACASCCLVSVDALQSVRLPEPHPDESGTSWFERACDRLSRAGWRHVGAPGTAHDWHPRPPRAAHLSWSDNGASGVDGPANECLSTHVLWTTTRLRPPRVLIDGACITDGRHNGSQSVVIEVARALARCRPDADVSLAVSSPFLEPARAVVGPDVTVVERANSVPRHDVVYRPYQLLDPNEVSWIERAGDRVLLGQLDMIAFSIPTYHPSPAMFHAVRNLQRSTMRRADAVTFISAFGRSTGLAECPDLDPRRLFVVSCGADPDPLEDAPPGGSGLVGGPFIASVSATFWHKNRRHAIEVFADLCRRHGYPGSLVVAGPEPFYGTSLDDEDQLIGTLEPSIADRILRPGLLDESSKWWLLRHADVVLYPSIIEGFGLVPFEAASVGTPSLSFAGSAVLEVLGTGPATIASWDPTQWSDAVARIVEDRSQVTEVLEQVTDARNRHTWDRVGELTWQAIDRTVARPRAARFDEEGSLRSRVGASRRGVGVGAGSVHFANRAASYARRRLSRSASFLRP